MTTTIEEKYEALMLHCQWVEEALDAYIEDNQHLHDCINHILTTHKLWKDGEYAMNDGTIFHKRNINE
jgi:hypothetical protein